MAAQSTTMEMQQQTNMQVESLTADQLTFLRRIFLSLSDRPEDVSHVHSFIERHYRNIPKEVRHELGLNERIWKALESSSPSSSSDEEAEIGATGKQQNEDDDGERKDDASEDDGNDEGKGVLRRSRPLSRAPPRITWPSFQRVCAAMGLHLNDRRGREALRKCMESVSVNNNTSSSPAASSSKDPSLSFDSFIRFYAQSTTYLSEQQELESVWALLDADLSGRVPLRILRQVLVGLESISPSNTNDPERTSKFFHPNYHYHYTSEQKAMSSEELVDDFLSKHFAPRGKDLDNDDITFDEFVEFMYS